MKTSTPFKLLFTFCAVLISSLAMAQTTIDCQNFQSNRNGWDNANGSRQAENISGSSHSLKLENNQYATSDQYNFSAYDNVTLEFTFESRRFETDSNDDDSYIVQFNDGSGWVSLQQVYCGYGFENDIDQVVTISISKDDYNFSNGTNDRFRIKNHTDSSNDDLYIDDICITGDAIGSEAYLTSNSIEIVDGDTTPSTADNTDFGSVDYGGGSIVKTFTFKNTGSENLTIGAITFGGTNSADFSVLTSPSATVTPGNTTTFQVEFDPLAPGISEATISIVTNDSSENPYNFSIEGYGNDNESVQIACQDFESNDDVWDNDTGSRENENISGSAYSYKLTRNQYAESDTFDFSPYNLVSIEFTFETKNFETDSNDDDSYIVEFNDGSGWVSLQQVYCGYGFENNVDQTIVISVAATDYDFTDGTNDQFRIKNHSDSTNDFLFLDDICIEGSVFCYDTLVCTGTTTWDGTSWDNGQPTSSDLVIIDGDYDTSSNGNFESCKLIVNSGKTLNIDNSGLVKVQSDVTIIGVVTIANNGGLLQYYDFATNTGDITIVRESTGMYKFDYTYWSSPVTNYNLSNIDHNRAYYWDEATDKWTYALGVMEPGRGYILMTNNTSKTVTETTTATFTGAMNNGKSYQDVSVGASEWNLLGNPYPSAIDASDFVLDAGNSALLEGTLYFWTHNTRISGIESDRGEFIENDYASWNLTGGIGAASGETAVPDGKIASGQGFFVEANGTGEVKFTNCMRSEGAYDNSSFFRPAESSTITEEGKIWLDITNKGGSYKQILVGYVSGASNAYDRLFDGASKNGENVVSLYTLIDDSDKKLGIQGRALPFSISDVVKIGFSLEESASKINTISLNNIKGSLIENNVFLIDTYNNVVHDLKSGSYEFESEYGEFNDRFELAYEYRTLSTNIETVESRIEEVRVSTGNNVFNVKSEESELSSVVVYDALGKIVYSQDGINSNILVIDSLTVTKSLYVVVSSLTNGTQVTTKVLF